MQKSRWPFGHRDFAFWDIENQQSAFGFANVVHVLTSGRMTMGGFVARYEDRHWGLSLRVMGEWREVLRGDCVRGYGVIHSPKAIRTARETNHQKAMCSPFLVGTGGAYNERSE